LKGGLLKDIIDRISDKVTNGTKSEITIYSSDETFIGALYKLLSSKTNSDDESLSKYTLYYNTTQLQQPDILSTISIELRKSINDNRYYIKILQRNDTTDSKPNLNPVLIEGNFSLYLNNNKTNSTNLSN
jgi:hypothetical protein